MCIVYAEGHPENEAGQWAGLKTCRYVWKKSSGLKVAQCWRSPPCLGLYCFSLACVFVFPSHEQCLGCTGFVFRDAQGIMWCWGTDSTHPTVSGPAQVLPGGPGSLPGAATFHLSQGISDLGSSSPCRVTRRTRLDSGRSAHPCAQPAAGRWCSGATQ